MSPGRAHKQRHADTTPASPSSEEIVDVHVLYAGKLGEAGVRQAVNGVLRAGEGGQLHFLFGRIAVPRSLVDRARAALEHAFKKAGEEGAEVRELNGTLFVQRTELPEDDGANVPASDVWGRRPH